MNKLKNHVLFQYASSVIQTCSYLSQLNIDGFIFMRRFPDGTFIDLSNQLKWSEDFLTRFLQGEFDQKNVDNHMLIQPGVSLWSHNPDNSIWKEGRIDWGFHSGISIAKEGPNWTDIFCFYSRKMPAEMDVEFLKNFHLLEKFALLFVDRFQKVICLGEEHRLITPSLYLSHSSHQKKLLPELTSQIEQLSARERECIFYVAKGNTAAEVGKIMHLSQRTVETYLQTAKDKMCVKKTSDLIKLFPEW